MSEYVNDCLSLYTTLSLSLSLSRSVCLTIFWFADRTSTRQSNIAWMESTWMPISEITNLTGIVFVL